MNVKQEVLRLGICATVLLAVMVSGCKYDVAEPQWYKPYDAPPTPAITQVNPAQATPGVNTITIVGTNFAVAPDVNNVYFDNVAAEIISTSGTSITVRRPNLVTDSATVKVVPSRALVVAKTGPYKISPVVVKYGGFLSNVPLNVVAVDANENMYVVEGTTRNVVLATSTGDHIIKGTLNRTPTDMVIGPDGRLYCPGNNRAIDVVDLATSTVSQWLQMPSGKIVKYGDFDEHGNYFTAGSKTDLLVVHPDLSTSATALYTKDVVLGVRVHDGYVYVIDSIAPAPAGRSTKSICRNQILDAQGTLGPTEVVIDWTTTGAYATRPLKSIAFTTDGHMIVGTDAADPLLLVDLSAKTVDVFYKGLLQSNCKAMAYGSGTYLYMLRGDTNLQLDWTVYRVDMGMPGAQ